jgi:hypothetical protein
VLYEAVTFIPVALSNIQGGMSGGASVSINSNGHGGPSVSLSDGIATVAGVAGVTVLRSMEVVALGAGFVYGLYRSVGAVIDH